MNLFTFSKKFNPVAEWTFSDGVLPSASIYKIDVRSGGSVVSSPIEQGSFNSYNKTAEPMELNVVLSFSGTDSFLQSTLDTLENLKQSVTVFSIETPIYEYENMTLQNYDYQLQREDGRGVLYINAMFVEIKEVAVTYTATSIQANDTKDSSAASSVNTGLKQAQEPQQSGSNVESAGKNTRKSILRQAGIGG